jgi:plastocyanin
MTWLLTTLLLGAPASGETGAVQGTVTFTREPGVAPSAVVVYVVGFEEPPPPAVAEVHQHERHFDPELLPITAGQRVSFPNDDLFFHNVFSPSPAREFDLGQYPQGSTMVKLFPNVGVVDVYCNIHPEMAATVLVLPNRRFTTVKSDGSFRIDGVPAGKWKLYAYSRRATAPVSEPIVVQAGKTTATDLSLAEKQVDFSHRNKYGEKYRDPEKYR